MRTVGNSGTVKNIKTIANNGIVRNIQKSQNMRTVENIPKKHNMDCWDYPLSQVKTEYISCNDQD